MDEKFREFSEFKESNKSLEHELAVANPGGEGAMPPQPCKNKS